MEVVHEGEYKYGFLDGENYLAYLVFDVEENKYLKFQPYYDMYGAIMWAYLQLWLMVEVKTPCLQS